jgi:predicted transcriptional regulator
MDNEEMAREIAKSAQAFSEPIDFDKLIKEGLLTKKGRSFYVTDLKALPETVSRRIKEIASTKDGLRVSFYKESKSLKKLATKLSGYLE